MILHKALVVLTGFSIVSAAILSIVYSMMYRSLNKSWISILSANALLLLFATIQWLHLDYFFAVNDLINSKFYSTLVLLTAPLYLLFVVEYIGGKLAFKPTMLLHLTPLVVNAVLPNTWSLPVLLLGIFLQVLNPQYFIVGYSLLISACFLLVVTTLLLVPDVAINLNEALESRYVKSTLENLDQDSMLAALNELIGDEKLSRDENLNLSLMAERSGYSSHQISELINSKLGYGVSHFIRQHRIEDAKQMLLDEPDASVLSVSLAAGFTSQSTFYAAFNQITGVSPGKYRKNHSTS